MTECDHVWLLIREWHIPSEGMLVNAKVRRFYCSRCRKVVEDYDRPVPWGALARKDSQDD